MKRYIFLLLLFPLLSFSQEMTKKELKKIVKECIQINNSKIVSYKDLIMISNNTDSIFFKASKIKIFTDRKSPRINNFCRTVELKFIDKKFISFNDCQVCKEPSSCFATTEKKMYTYKIIEENKELLLVFENKFENREYKITETKRDENKKISEFTLIRI